MNIAKGMLRDHHDQEDKQQVGKLYENLCRPKSYHTQIGNGDQRGEIPNRISIEGRTEVVERQVRIDDWEADTINDRGH